jgi:hypothetical protein
MPRLLLLSLLVPALAGCARGTPVVVVIPPWMEESVRLHQADGPPPALPDARSIGAAFNQPILQHCDELACWHAQSRVFKVRALECSATPSERPDSIQARCRYERQLLPREGEPGPWHLAETELSRFTDPALPGSPWGVLRDMTPP